MFLVYDNFGRFLAKRRIAKGEERKGMHCSRMEHLYATFYILGHKHQYVNARSGQM